MPCADRCASYPDVRDELLNHCHHDARIDELGGADRYSEYPAVVNSFMFATGTVSGRYTEKLVPLP